MGGVVEGFQMGEGGKGGGGGGELGTRDREEEGGGPSVEVTTT